MSDFVQNPRSRDWWIVPTYFDADNNQIVINDGGGDEIVDLPVSSVNKFWPHKTAFSGYPGIYYTLTADALSGPAIDLDFRPCSPTDSPDQYGKGLEVFSADPLTLVFSSGDWTMDPRLFGYPEGWNTDVVLVASGAEYVAPSPMSRRTTWRSYTIGESGKASRKRIMPEQVTAWSHNRPQDRYAITWEEQEVRSWQYEYVPAAHLFEQDAANLEDYARNQGLGLGDNHNAFETIWRALAQNEIALIVHDQDSWDLELNGDFTEAAVLEIPTNSLGQIASLRRTAGDFWDLNFTMYSLGLAS